MNYVRTAALVFVVLLFPAGYLKGCSDEKERFDDFKTMVEATGKAQEERTAARIAHDELLKEEADNDHQVALAELRAHVKRLRRDADRSVLPATPAGSKCPDGQTCYDLGELDRAVREYTAGLRALADQCSQMIVELETARKWAHGRERGP